MYFNQDNERRQKSDSQRPANQCKIKYMTKVSTYCAFCRLPRSIYRKKGVNWVNVLQALGLACGSSYLIWRELDPRAMIIFVGSLAVMEIFILLRTRSEIECPHCGFDPVLYKRDPAKACEKVKLSIEARKEDPNVWLARRPPLRLPKRKRSSTREIVA
ncbi:MAG: hypothetical protein IT289_11695 [Oligoflexia bacterium]|nr:hypothetical protein [Oligoflexia bacterium]